VVRGANVEVTSRGAALVAAVGADPSFDPRTLEYGSKATRKFDPQSSSARADALLEGWSRAVARARSGANH
jgi:glycerol kinase